MSHYPSTQDLINQFYRIASNHPERVDWLLDIANLIAQNQPPEQPDGCDDALYQAMCEAWEGTQI